MTMIDEVASYLPKRRGSMPWYEALPPELASECEQIKEAWKAGTMGTKTALGYALSRSLKARGIDIGHAGVIKWLEKA